MADERKLNRSPSINKDYYYYYYYYPTSSISQVLHRKYTSPHQYHKYYIESTPHLINITSIT